MQRYAYEPDEEKLNCSPGFHDFIFISKIIMYSLKCRTILVRIMILRCSMGMNLNTLRW